MKTADTCWLLRATLIACVAALPMTLRADEPLAQVLGGGGLSVYPRVDDALSLTVAGRGFWQRLVFDAGENGVFRPNDEQGYPLPDGIYRYELRVVDSGSEDAGADPTFAPAPPRAPTRHPVQTGTLQISQGSVSILSNARQTAGGL